VQHRLRLSGNLDASEPSSGRHQKFVHSRISYQVASRGPARYIVMSLSACPVIAREMSWRPALNAGRKCDWKRTDMTPNIIGNSFLIPAEAGNGIQFLQGKLR
jgi:hypothetical protein